MAAFAALDALMGAAAAAPDAAEVPRVQRDLCAWLVGPDGLARAVAADHGAREWDRLVSALVTLPDKLANACGAAGCALEPLLAPAAYSSLVVGATTRAAVATAAQRAPATGALRTDTPYYVGVASLLSHMCRRFGGPGSHADVPQRLVASLLGCVLSALLATDAVAQRSAPSIEDDGAGRGLAGLLPAAAAAEQPGAVLPAAASAAPAQQQQQLLLLHCHTVAAYLLEPGVCLPAAGAAHKRAIVSLVTALANLAGYSQLDVLLTYALASRQCSGGGSSGASGIMSGAVAAADGARALESEQQGHEQQPPLEAGGLPARLRSLLLLLLGHPTSLPPGLAAALSLHVWTFAGWPSQVVAGLLGYLCWGLALDVPPGGGAAAHAAPAAAVAAEAAAAATAVTAAAAPPPAAGGGPAAVYRDAREFLARVPLLRLAALWAQPAFVSAVEPRLQASLTRALVRGLAVCPHAVFDLGATDCVLTLMGGVQLRMEHADLRVRGMGLRVAEAFSGRTLARSYARAELGADAAAGAARQARRRRRRQAKRAAAAAAGFGGSGDVVGDDEEGTLDDAAATAAAGDDEFDDGGDADDNGGDDDDGGGDGLAAELAQATDAVRMRDKAAALAADGGPPVGEALRFDADLTLDAFDFQLRCDAAPATDDARVAGGARLPLARGVLEEECAQLALAAPRLRAQPAAAAADAPAPAAPASAQTPEAGAARVPVDVAALSIDVLAFARTGVASAAVVVAAPAAPRVTVRPGGAAGATVAALGSGGGGAVAAPGGTAPWHPRPPPPPPDSPALAAARAVASKAPATLSDVPAALREETDFERVLAALAPLARMVRSAAASPSLQAALLREGPQLLRALVTLEDRFALPEFALWRHCGLVSLVVALGPLATHALHALFWGFELSDGHRLELLDVLVGASVELAGRTVAVVPLPPWELELEAAAARASSDGGGVGGGRGRAGAAPAPAPAGATEAGGAGSASASASASPLFGEVCREWFFAPLLRGVLTGRPHQSAGRSGGGGARVARSHGGGGGDDEEDALLLPSDVAASLRGDALRLLHAGPGALVDSGSGSSSSGSSASGRSPSRAGLLAASLRALAAFLEAAGADASAPAMARSLLALAWTQRRHADVGVRRACLCAFAAVIAALHVHGGSPQLATPSVLQAALAQEAAADAAREEAAADARQQRGAHGGSADAAPPAAAARGGRAAAAGARRGRPLVVELAGDDDVGVDAELPAAAAVQGASTEDAGCSSSGGAAAGGASQHHGPSPAAAAATATATAARLAPSPTSGADAGDTSSGALRSLLSDGQVAAQPPTPDSGVLRSLLAITSAPQHGGGAAAAAATASAILSHVAAPPPGSRSGGGGGPLGASAARANALLARAAASLLAPAGAQQLSAREAAAAAALVGAPLLWDDVLAVAAHLRAVADGEPDEQARALAALMLRNAILRGMVLGPEDEAQAQALAA